MKRIFVAIAAMAVAAAFSLPAQAESFTKEEVKGAQAALFELDLKYNKMSGKVDIDMENAVRRWQAKEHHAVTGTLTRQEYKTLVATRPPPGRRWASVSFAQDSQYGFVWNKKTRAAAHQASLRACRAQSRFPDDCFTTDAFKDGAQVLWIASMFCTDEKDESKVRLFGGTGISRTDAENWIKAFGKAMGGYSPNTCTILPFRSAAGES